LAVRFPPQTADHARHDAGTVRRFYWVGDPAVWLSLGAMFGMLEVIPLVFMVIRAWREYRAVCAAGKTFPQHTAFGFFTAAAVSNLAGAGILGGIINPPIVNYYGTASS
jgi:nitric oxide reductase subunit B